MKGIIENGMYTVFNKQTRKEKSKRKTRQKYADTRRLNKIRPADYIGNLCVTKLTNYIHSLTGSELVGLEVNHKIIYLFFFKSFASSSLIFFFLFFFFFWKRNKNKRVKTRSR